ncbi:threonine--tRNA ligase [Patescibacteria group bacterium]|nr:threonine--tRNA ligase [Patescibacteria group bacterium]MBU1967455.1 threonine--tRNA ligase [Patescibacteria group bacterium]
MSNKQNNNKQVQLKADKSNLWKLRHTAEHVLHQAVKELYPSIHLAMGPATQDGFYFDFDNSPEGAIAVGPAEITISQEDFPKIEAKMQEIIDLDLPLIEKEISVTQARELFAGNPYKLEWVDEIETKGEMVTVYWSGEPGSKRAMVDLCAGPHVASTGEVKAFKLLSVAGAYWHGNEKNKMLTRIYGVAFYSQKELDEYMELLEKAKENDHRKLGKKLDLFTIEEKVGKGLVLWLPKGNIIKEELENFAKQIEKEWGYQRVTTPNICKEGLYHTSGHLPYYKDDLYPPMKLDDGEDYYLKPMNCPHHHMIYAARPKSYRDLPLRLAEYGTCYRYESSGELFGLMRVRGFTQNDAHIYCTKEQAVDEFVQVMKLHEFFYQALGIKDYYLELALRDPKKNDKYHGDDQMWALAEKLMREAVSRVDIKMVEEAGSAAFYGPKIDFVVRSSIGREFALSTNQIDLYMGDRFGLKYVDQDGLEKTPVIIHRAPLGSHERFIGFLIEHFGGKFPLWLSPVQVKILPISQAHHEYAQKFAKELQEKGIRVELDDRSETLSAKIRNAQMEKVPYMAVVGDRELENNSLAVRVRDGQKQEVMKVAEFVSKLQKEIRKF